MKYLISTTDRRDATDIETRLRMMGTIKPQQRLQSFPSKTIPGGLDIYLVDPSEQTHNKKKPSPAAPKPVARRAWYDNADVITALLVSLLLGILFRGLL